MDHNKVLLLLDQWAYSRKAVTWEWVIKPKAVFMGDLEMWQILVSIGFLLVIAEAFTAGFFALPAGLAFLATAFWAPFIESNTTLGMLLSAHLIASYLLTHRVIKPRFAVRKIDTAAQGMLGKEAVVTTAIEPHSNQGYVKLYADHWAAHAERTIEVGERVKILSVEGNRVFVERV